MQLWGKLDAKHTMPWTLEAYLYKKWDSVARILSEFEKASYVEETEYVGAGLDYWEQDDGIGMW